MDNGGPVFPTGNDGWTDEGMSLRDYFAAKAMSALLGQTCHDADGPFAAFDTNATNARKRLARQSYEIADEMLSARKAEAA